MCALAETVSKHKAHTRHAAQMCVYRYLGRLLLEAKCRHLVHLAKTRDAGESSVSIRHTWNTSTSVKRTYKADQLRTAHDQPVEQASTGSAR